MGDLQDERSEKNRKLHPIGRKIFDRFLQKGYKIGYFSYFLAYFSMFFDTFLCVFWGKRIGFLAYFQGAKPIFWLPEVVILQLPYLFAQLLQLSSFQIFPAFQRFPAARWAEEDAMVCGAREFGLENCGLVNSGRMVNSGNLGKTGSQTTSSLNRVRKKCFTFR